jgi:hypothetical protein
MRARTPPIMTSSPQPALPHTDYQRFESFLQYEAMLDELIPVSLRVIRIFDRTLPASYNSSARCELVTRFLRSDPANRVYVVLHDTAELTRTCPRFAAVLQRYAHLARVRQTPRNARHLYDPFVIFDGSHYLHRFHYDHMRYARGMNDPDGTQQLVDRFNELWEVSRPVSTGGPVGL